MAYELIKTLKVGEKFRLPLSGKTGTVMEQSDYHTEVKYDGVSKEITIGETSFIATSKKTVRISNEAQIERI